ncbi:hypothetical protein PanWU01x14_256760 [Parasponia andersonii]|uniref:Uncharacterized protein n=1 Tax=Parasponia andersonii TaxID=3476 RepID=A0A2P5BA64_PARAD|nr:hypothetical protein PanWU01x14_256760 [Parasponia andersonii]
MTKTSSLVQIRKVIRELMGDHEDGLKDIGSVDTVKSSEKTDALEEARLAIEHVVIPKGEPVELLPRPPHIISLQLDLIQKYQLEAERIGSGADTQLRILPFHTTEEGNSEQNSMPDNELDDFINVDGNSNGSPYVVDRLPLLPE